ncbi:MAG: phytanoyl-CoA dioxygenase family protein [Chthoniobacterales bacterium]|nr:phytanoyl-CoA dioxygenase family protein [Chthoniobacterales bacterium]
MSAEETVPTFTTDGFEIHRGVLSDSQVDALRKEADSVAASEGSACARHLRSRSRIFSELSVSDSLLSLLPEPLRPVRSILFDKTPDENWPVAWHQDLTITVVQEQDVPGYGPWSHKDGIPHVQPPTSLLQNMATIRLHLDDTPASNGALRVIPGSHRHGRISADAVSAYDKANAVVCECRPGDVVLMSPLLLHSSLRSVAPARRRVVHFEYARETDLDPRLQWFEPLETSNNGQGAP